MKHSWDMQARKPTVEQVAQMFMASPEAVRSQYRRNASQLRGIAKQAGEGRSRGASKAKWNALAQSAEDAACGVSELRNAIRVAQSPKSVQWRLRGPNGEFVGLNRFLAPAFVSERDALVFDGRDNEVAKLNFFRLSLDVRVELL